MCGIAGIFDIGRAPDPGALRCMARRLAHRGPDAEGIYHDADVGLVHRRLSIIDLAGGAQPMKSVDGNLILVANGEIYNFLELRRELAGRGHRFRTGSDCEVILHVYAEFGIQGVERLHGMFAFALYDGRERKLLLGRDRLGIKPLFLARSGSAWVFASEIKALLPALRQRPNVSAEALAQLLHNGSIHGGDQLLEGVSEVPPGHCVTIGEGAKREFRYWNLTDVRPLACTEAEGREQLDALMEEVMREHVRSDVPYGLLLSGGVDSGTLAALLATRQPAALNTFSIGFTDSRTHNELDDAERVARRFGTRHHRVEMDPDELEDRVVEAVWAVDGLIVDPAVLPTLVLAQEAARHLKVVFTGEGGDEVFAGYGRYRLASPLRRIAALVDRQGGGLGRRSHWGDAWRGRSFGAALAGGWGTRRAGTCRAWCHSPPHWGALRRRQFVDLNTSLPGGLLIKVDRALMAYGLEGRVPFLDHRIVEFGLSLPAHLKIRGKQKKYLLKRWAERHLPKEHLYRRKRGFHVPLEGVLSFRRIAELESILPGTAGIQEWFDPDGVRRLLRRQVDNGDVAGEVWSLLLFALWHALHVEGDGARPPAGVSIAEVLSGCSGSVETLAPPPPMVAADPTV